MKTILIILLLILTASCNRLLYHSDYIAEYRPLFTHSEINSLEYLFKNIENRFNTKILVVVLPKKPRKDQWMIKGDDIIPDLTIVIHETKYDIIKHMAYNGFIPNSKIEFARDTVFEREMKKLNCFNAIVSTVAYMTN